MGQAGGYVQQPAAQRLGFGFGEVACQGEQPQSGDQVGADRGDGFTSNGVVKNLLDEASDDFTSTFAAYNTAVVDYLLEESDELATNVVAHIVSHFDTQAQEFLTCI